MLKLAFVLEQTLGHVSHSRNIERALADATDIQATVIKLPYPPRRWAGGLPALQNWSLRASWAARQALLARLREDRLDAIFIHTQVPSLLSRSIMRAVPTVISLDATPLNIDYLGAAYRHQRGPRAVEMFKRQVNRRALGSARALVCWCAWAAESLQRDYGVDAAKVCVVHPGVDLELFRPDDTRDENRTLRLLFVGGDFARKGGHELLQAVRSLNGRVELDIVSPTAPAIDAPNLRVHVALKPQSEGLLDLYRNADVFVLPTQGDCFPQVIAEAMASGLPIVATDVGGIPEMVTHGVNGFLVPTGAPGALASALRRLVDDKALRERLGQQSLARARVGHDAMRNNRTIFGLMAGLAAVRQAVPA